MASESNTRRYFLEKKSNGTGPFPPSSRKESSDSTFDPSTAIAPSSSSVGRHSLASCRSSRSIPKRSSRRSSDERGDSRPDEEIKSLLRKKLARRILRGEPFETLRYHQRRLMRELGEWMGVASERDECEGGVDAGSDFYKHRLLGLLSSASRGGGRRDVPSDVHEWNSLLNRWLRANTSGVVLSNREVYRILAVDGFRGFAPKQLRLYLPGLLCPLRKEYESHVRGVRRMYDRFATEAGVCGLTGTDSACIVFVALIDWYSQRTKTLDDRTAFLIGRKREWAEGYLRQHGDYYPDVKNVDAELLRRFGESYREGFGKDEESMTKVGTELLASLGE